MTSTDDTIPRTPRSPHEIVRWAKDRDAALQAKGDAILRMASGLTTEYASGRLPSREDLVIALVRMTSLAADAMSLSRQVVAASHAATSLARGSEEKVSNFCPTSVQFTPGVAHVPPTSD